MSAKPKLRIFAGPNGSGKTTLFESIKSIYFSTKLFINADLLEEQFRKNQFINFSDFKLNVESEDFETFCRSSGLYKKAGFTTETWSLQVRENVLVKDVKRSNADFNSYHFAIIADFLRVSLIESGQSYSFETVFSHPSKLDLINFAIANGYKVYLYFIGTETPKMNLERVKDRVFKGGHFVSSEKIEQRYFLTMDLLLDMIKIADETYLWDNSGQKHQFIGKIKNGIAEFKQLTVPAWIDAYILKKIVS
jgi:predicted ABC-type ATPase